jgi:hypothetical protein
MKLKDQRQLIRLITKFINLPAINAACHLDNKAGDLAGEIEQLLTDQGCFIETDDGQTVLAAALLGRRGGQAKTEAKAAASRANGKGGGRPPLAEPSAKALYRREYRKRLAEAVKKVDQNNSSTTENSG